MSGSKLELWSMLEVAVVFLDPSRAKMPSSFLLPSSLFPAMSHCSSVLMSFPQGFVHLPSPYLASWGVQSSRGWDQPPCVPVLMPACSLFGRCS